MMIVDRMRMVEHLEGLPGSSDGCLLALTLEVPTFLRVGDVWWVENAVMYVRRGDASPMAHRGRLEWRRKW
ncbi:hypothetical protein [Micromonospora robiginosa]|uniref:Uncharacterized protein n=1 Tax=Micromonospora robiginosa TaxID=2749844 RepID=A0A7L6B0T6_9ACTN|nr:hypothetical protein [Micromonospora ferruginea]QLQ35589.1 hypothetical protein H1D33_19680 [Micromonospora ferruginea]